MHDIDLASLRFTHLQGYENEICNRYDVNTVVRYVKGVKMLINYGIKEGYLEFNPFIKHKSRKTVTKPILYLTEEEVSKLEQKDFDNQRLDEVRDFFLLQCYSGMSFADHLTSRVISSFPSFRFRHIIVFYF